MENEKVQNTQVIKTSEWVITLLIMIIPLVNLIMLFIWAFGGETNPNKANWAKASLIWAAIGIVLAFLFGVFAAIFSSALLSGL